MEMLPHSEYFKYYYTKPITHVDMTCQLYSFCHSRFLFCTNHLASRCYSNRL